jgi:UDP-2,3-diacylglucosamine pyrophosphatase LpxH
MARRPQIKNSSSGKILFVRNDHDFFFQKQFIRNILALYVQCSTSWQNLRQLPVLVLHGVYVMLSPASSQRLYIKMYLVQMDGRTDGWIDRRTDRRAFAADIM